MSRFGRDALERVAWTCGQAAAGAALDALSTGDVTWRAVAYAGLLAVLKVLAARKVGDRDSAAIMPPRG